MMQYSNFPAKIYFKFWHIMPGHILIQWRILTKCAPIYHFDLKIMTLVHAVVTLQEGDIYAFIQCSPPTFLPKYITSFAQSYISIYHGWSYIDLERIFAMTCIKSYYNVLHMISIIGKLCWRQRVWCIHSKYKSSHS